MWVYLDTGRRTIRDAAISLSRFHPNLPPSQSSWLVSVWKDKEVIFFTKSCFYYPLYSDEWAGYILDLPIHGMIVNNIGYPLQVFTPTTDVPDTSYHIPTPTAMDGIACKEIEAMTRWYKRPGGIDRAKPCCLKEWVHPHLWPSSLGITTTGQCEINQQKQGRWKSLTSDKMQLNPIWIEILMGFPATWTITEDKRKLKKG